MLIKRSSNLANSQLSTLHLLRLAPPAPILALHPTLAASTIIHYHYLAAIQVGAQVLMGAMDSSVWIFPNLLASSPSLPSRNLSRLASAPDPSWKPSII